ncbi:EEF1A lysine methyltransferase 2 [Achroia grisella]|uniref:EEF1A lysine methyltransferase 2 n=1 Tax=Achroia grisella TaxID=688607 RepID=UPI0027D23B5A|nr:EEF1A lysine methyltransferase 2 [Achroia grisella]
MDDSELNASELGTFDYWQKAYTTEIINYDEHGDPGEVWFGEDSAQRVIDWISTSGIDKDISFVDLGCGNGYSLLELARRGFTNLIGVDYCPEAIMLAKKITKEEFPSIKYKLFDIIKDDLSNLGTEYGIVHDKGTYDAVSLNPDNPKENRQKYLEQVTNMLSNNGLFVITSCNWTDQELIQHFSEKMKLKCVIPTPQFKFGGKVGSVISSVVFIKK